MDRDYDIYMDGPGFAQLRSSDDYLQTLELKITDADGPLLAVASFRIGYLPVSSSDLNEHVTAKLKHFAELNIAG